MANEEMKKLQGEDFEIPESKIAQIASTGESTVQILETGKFVKDGLPLEITESQMDSFVENFQNQVLGTDPPVNFGHERTGKASGWVKQLFLDPTKTKLFAVIKWTAAGLEALKGRTWRYVSAEFTDRFVDGSIGKEFGPTLAGVALTNVPFLRHMPPVVGLSSESSAVELKQLNLDNNKGEDVMANDEKSVLLADHNAAVKVLTQANEKLSSELDELKKLSEEAPKLKKANVDLTKKLSDLESKIEAQSKEAEFAQLLSEGKACAAQKDAFMSGNMSEFIKLAKPINLDGVGSGNDPEDKVEKFSDLPASEQKMFNENLSATMTKEEFMKFRAVPLAPCRYDEAN